MNINKGHYFEKFRLPNKMFNVVHSKNMKKERNHFKIDKFFSQLLTTETEHNEEEHFVEYNDLYANNKIEHFINEKRLCKR